MSTENLITRVTPFLHTYNLSTMLPEAMCNMKEKKKKKKGQTHS